MGNKMRRLRRRNRIPTDELTVLDMPLLGGFMSGVLVQDRSQSSNDGTAAGGTGIPSQLYPGFNFIRLNTHAIGASGVLISTYPITINCWMKSAVGIVVTAASIGNSASIIKYVTVGIATDNTGEYVIRVAGTENSSRVTATATSLFDGEWHMITGVSSGETSHKVYVDGVLINTITTSKVWSAMDKWSVGSRAGSTNNEFFDGSLAETKIIAKALSAEEIQSIFNVTKFRYRVSA